VRTLRVVDDDQRPCFTPKTLAAFLAISERTARQLLADETIPSFKIAGQRRILAEDVYDYVAHAKRKAA